MKVRDLINSPTHSPTPDHRSVLYTRHQRANGMLHPSPSVPPSRAPSPLTSSNGRRYSRRASIVLVGMPGVGKSTIASIVAKALGWAVFDTDTIFRSKQHMSVSESLNIQGYKNTRIIEADILADVLQHTVETVIACGAGVIEHEPNRTLLLRFRDEGPIIHIIREKEAIAAYMRDFGQDPASWEQQAALFRECCSFEFASLTVPVPSADDIPMDSGVNELSVIFKPVEQDFFRLLRFIHGVDANKVSLGPRGHRTYLLALTYDDINKMVPHLDDLSIGVDLWAVRADLLSSCDLNYLSFQIATLRRHSPLPHLFMIRTQSRTGKYPDVDPHNIHALESFLSLFQHALRLGMEYVELELDYPTYVVDNVVPLKGNSSVIVAFFDWQHQYTWDNPETKNIYKNIVNMGADVATMILRARTFEDNLSLRTFATSVENGPIPLIAINMGIEGKMSRALNHNLSPVSHPLLPGPPAYGHITFRECQTILYLTGLLPPKKHYVFGHPIPHSMSPALHNAAFAALGLPHVYYKVDTPDLGVIKKVMESPDFGGASVTLPHARDIIPLLQQFSRHAQVIGAVNTIFPVSWGGRGLYGDNTDWKGIKNCLLRSLTPAHTVTSTTTALVLGAGGSARATIYALYRIGVVNVFVYNRDRQKAQCLADEMQGLDHLLKISVLDHLSNPLPIYPPPTIIVSTIPALASSIASGVTERVDIGLRIEHLSPNGGVAMELAYEQRITTLLALAERRRQQSSPWVGVEGIEVLLEQGCEQCRIWTGRSAPVKQIRQKVLEVYDEMLRTTSENQRQ